MVQVDFNTMTTTVHPLSGLPKAAQKATYNLTESLQLFSSTVSNVWNFGTGRLRPYQGMKTLIHRFYDALDGRSQAPVGKEEALAVIETMDDIFGRIRKFPFRFEPILPRVLPKTDRKPSRILVTGATGFLGKRLVRVLLGRGYRVRALARKLSHTETLRGLDLEIYFGDVADPESLRASFDGVDYVIHAAADTAGNPEGGRVSTIRGTENVIQLCRDFGVKKLVYISSCGVYAVSKLKNHQTVTEGSPLEAFPEKRGSYSHAKLEAETRVRRAMSQGSAPVVCLRPGTIYGPGGEIFTPMMGFSLGRKLFLIIRRPGFVLPFVYVDNLIEAIVASLEAPNSAGQIYNVVDPEKIGKKEYVERFLKRLLPGSRYIYLPYSFIYSAVALQEILFKILKRNPLFTRYRLTSSQRKIVYDASKIKHDLHWSCPVSMNEAFKQILDDALREVSREGSGEDDRGKNSDRHRDGTESPLAPEDGLSEGDPGKRTNGEGSLRLDEEVPTRL
jgi:nucleoside-diphosphate-sugar epimerase